MKDGKTIPNIEYLEAGPSHFGPELIGSKSITQKAVYVHPSKLCSGLDCRLFQTSQSNCILTDFIILQLQKI